MHNLNLKLHKNILEQVFFLHDKRDFTIECVLEGTMCKVISDCQISPSVFLIKNGSFYILGGDFENSQAENILNVIPSGATILPSPESWISKLEKQPNVTLQKYERYSLNHESISIHHLDRIILSKSNQLTICQIDEAVASDISTNENFKYHLENFESGSDFLNKGLGFVAIYDGLIVGVASSALVCSSGYEISLMVLPKFRQKSIGKMLSANLVRAILNQNKIPHWDSANEISLNLAIQLGYCFKSKYQVHKVVKI